MTVGMNTDKVESFLKGFYAWENDVKQKLSEQMRQIVKYAELIVLMNQRPGLFSIVDGQLVAKPQSSFAPNAF